MTWLPSFVKLFLIFVAGVVLNIGSIALEVTASYNYTISTIAVTLRLLGLALMLVSPILIALKFFAQLDRRAK
jgi:hypothetical protein